MSGRTRWLEPVKTILILLLTVSAVFLMRKSRVFSALVPERTVGAPGVQEPVTLTYTAAAFPTEAAVTGQSGLCYGVKYDSGVLESMFDELSAYLGETVGSAETPKQITERSWQKLLDGASLYLDYDCSLPVSALAAWLGVEVPWEESLQTLILSEGGTGNVRLSFRDEEDACWQSETAASWSSLWERLNLYLPNGASFARHWEALKDCEPCMLVLETLPELYAVTASGSLQAASEALAEKTGINLSSSSRYSETDGTVVYPGETGVLRLYPDGSLSFTVSGEFLLAEADSVPAMLERSRALLEELRAPDTGDEVLRFSGCQFSDGLSGTVSFSYFCEGLPVLNGAGSAARAVWEKGRLQELIFLPRTYRLTGESAALLPEKQAAAAAGSRRQGGEAGLALYDGGDEWVTPFWQVK